MAAGRTLRSLVGRRRRADEEGEEDDGPVVIEDSQSEGSILSEADDDVGGDEGSLGDAPEVEPGAVEFAATIPPAPSNTSKAKKSRKPRKREGKIGTETSSEAPTQPTAFKMMADTQTMMNGLSIVDQAQDQDVVDFESTEPQATAGAALSVANGHSGRAVDQQRRDHEEYRRKRDSDPAFIPNRGNFFMHDTRGQPNGQAPPLRGAWQARNRGRGGANLGRPFSPAHQGPAAGRVAEQPWQHDLHDTINEEPQAGLTVPMGTSVPQNEPQDPHRAFGKHPSAPQQSRVLSFSSTKTLGTVQVRVSFAGIKSPIVFSEVPWKGYTRLPDHRPPLRRDKPVRVSLPGHTQRYIFPSPDRSFIFIPRQNRVNQPGYQRGQYQRSIGGYGYSSRRTSMYGGSIYSGSVAPSRRSSLAGISRDNAFSPVGSMVGMAPSRSIVRLPPGSHHYSAVSTPIGPLSGHQTPTGMPQIHSYPPPQQPAHFGTPTSTVQHPRPQKAISVTGLEPPILQGNNQAFRNQLPAHMHEQPPPPPSQPYFSPQNMVSPPHAQIGTPLSGIPEQAVHAPSFQPPAFGQPGFYAPYPPPQNYYYPPPATNGYPQMPMYMMPHHQGYMQPPSSQSMPQQHHAAPQPPAPAPNEDLAAQRAQSGMVAHESNGMVYYVPASEAQQSEQYQPAESFVPSYAISGLPPPTPAPENSMGYYYSSIQPGLQDVGAGAYYPPQSQQ